MKSEKEEEVITGDFTRLNEIEALTGLHSIGKKSSGSIIYFLMSFFLL